MSYVFFGLGIALLSIAWRGTTPASRTRFGEPEVLREMSPVWRALAALGGMLFICIGVFLSKNPSR
jgi:hypothetical protein